MKDRFSFLSKVEQDPSNLIKGLQLVQAAEGYVSEEGITAVAEYFNMPTVEVEGVVSFYAQFKRVKPGRHTISVCDGTACHIKGSAQVLEWLRQELKVDSGETTADGIFSLETVACLGCCSLAPVMSVDGKVFGKLDRKKMVKILKEYAD